MTGFALREVLIRKYLCLLSVCSLSFINISCMPAMPVIVDDYSMLKKDFFTTVIENVWEKNINNWAVIDPVQVQRSKTYFLGKNTYQVEQDFLNAGGECSASTEKLTINCSLSRYGRAKNIGAYADPKYLCDPGIQLKYIYYFSSSGYREPVVTDLKMFASPLANCSQGNGDKI